MIWSVSTLLSRSGTARPVWTSNFSMGAVSLRLRGVLLGDQVGGGGERATHRRGGGHQRRHQVGTATPALTPLEVAVGGGGAAFPGLELVRVRPQAHRATGLAPLGTGLFEDLPQAFLVGLLLDPHGTGHDEHAHTVGDLVALDDLRRGPQVLDPAVGARAQEDGVDLDRSEERRVGEEWK